MTRLLLIAVALIVLVAAPFLLLGDTLERGLTGDGAVELLRGYGTVAWIAAIGLLTSDILLPVPSSAVLAALGMLYGPVMGGAVGSLGMILAGLLGYGLCRWFGRPLALRLLGSERLVGGEQRFRRHGGWVIVLSRWVPVLAEVIVFAAGLAGMPFRHFAAAVALGSAPVGFFYAALGYGGSDRPVLTLLVCLVLPGLLWAGTTAVARVSRRWSTG